MLERLINIEKSEKKSYFQRRLVSEMKFAMLLAEKSEHQYDALIREAEDYVAAACEIYGFPCLIVDFGTATKYEVINEKGEFVAAVFSPGIGIAADALCSRAAQLPMIEIKKPASILNANTVECMQAGLVYGYIGQVEYIVEQIKKEMGLPDLKVIATGGFSKIFAQELSCIDQYDAALTLKGLQIIAKRNIQFAGGIKFR